MIKRVIEGLQILMKYSDRISSSYDCIISGAPNEEISASDAAALEALGWFQSKEYGTWSKFV